MLLIFGNSHIVRLPAVVCGCREGRLRRSSVQQCRLAEFGPCCRQIPVLFCTRGFGHGACGQIFAALQQASATATRADPLHRSKGSKRRKRRRNMDDVG